MTAGMAAVLLFLTLMLQVLTGSRAVSAAAAAAAPAAPNCTYVANLDKNGGDVAPSIRLGPPDSTRQARCCALCAAETNCHAGVLTGLTLRYDLDLHQDLQSS